jgi:hypothetical protein
MQAIHDKVFGNLDWEEAMSWWIGEYQYNDKLSIWVHIYVSDQKDLASVEKAHEMFSIIQQQENNYKEYAYSKTDELILDNDLISLSKIDFCEKLCLESIIFQGIEGGAEVAFDDGNIFGGHIIVVSLDEVGAAVNVRIEG